MNWLHVLAGGVVGLLIGGGGVLLYSRLLAQARRQGCVDSRRSQPQSPRPHPRSVV